MDRGSFRPQVMQMPGATDPTTAPGTYPRFGRGDMGAYRQWQQAGNPAFQPRGNHLGVPFDPATMQPGMPRPWQPGDGPRNPNHQNYTGPWFYPGPRGRDYGGGPGGSYGGRIGNPHGHGAGPGNVPGL
jgi:hypothetical protein